MGIRVKTKEGKEGQFDAAAFLQQQVPGAVVTGYDKATGEVKFKAGEKEGSFAARSMLASQGLEVSGVDELNKPEQAVDSSPLTWRERFELGYLTRESSDFQRLVGAVGSVFGGKPASDADIEANEKRALGQLKKRFGDAKVVNGELVVKHDGVWKKVDSSSDSIGEDAAQLLGNSGLNILGAIAGAQIGAVAGAPLGPAGSIAGGIIGGVGGSMVGELAEEATAVGIVGGEIDPAGVARDLMTEGMLGLAGEGLGAAGGKVVSKLTKVAPEAAARLAQAEAVRTEATVVKGMSKFANEADGKVKDMVAQTYSTINPELSEAPLREAIDSAENMVKANAYSKVVRKLPRNAPNPLLRDMATGLQEGVDKAMNVAEDKFGAVLNQVRSKVDDNFTIDLEQRLTDLQAASLTAPKDKRAYFNVVENETRQVLNAVKKEGEPAVLKGKQALALVERQRAIITQKLKDTGAFDPQSVPGSDDRLLHKAMSTIKSYMDSELLDAAERTQLAPAFNDMKNMYRATKDSVEAIWSKTFSNKRDLSFAQNVAKGQVDANVTESLATLHSLHPEAKINETLSDMRLKQAGIEMTPLFKMQSLKTIPGALHGAASAGATAVASSVAGPVGGAAALAATASPRGAAIQARGAARVSETLTKGALVKALPQARAQARSLMGIAYSSGFLRTLNQSTARGLIQNPDLFKQYLEKVNSLTSSLAKTDENVVTEAAIKASQGGVK